MFDLLAPTSLDQLLLIIIYFKKTSYLNEEVSLTEPSPSVSVPWCMLYMQPLTVLKTRPRFSPVSSSLSKA